MLSISCLELLCRCLSICPPILGSGWRNECSIQVTLLESPRNALSATECVAFDLSSARPFENRAMSYAEIGCCLFSSEPSVLSGCLLLLPRHRRLLFLPDKLG